LNESVCLLGHLFFYFSCFGLHPTGVLVLVLVLVLMLVLGATGPD
jgi:hypothetical protein